MSWILRMQILKKTLYLKIVYTHILQKLVWSPFKMLTHEERLFTMSVYLIWGKQCLKQWLICLCSDLSKTWGYYTDFVYLWFSCSLKLRIPNGSAINLIKSALFSGLLNCTNSVPSSKSSAVTVLSKSSWLVVFPAFSANKWWDYSSVA